MGFGTEVLPIQKSLFDPECIAAIASCDVVFGCVDSVDGRYLLNRLAVFHSIPYFDLGVKLEADGRGGVDQVCGSVHYVQPQGSSLLSRRLFTMAEDCHEYISSSYRQCVSALLRRNGVRGSTRRRQQTAGKTAVARGAVHDPGNPKISVNTLKCSSAQVLKCSSAQVLRVRT